MALATKLESLQSNADAEELKASAISNVAKSESAKLQRLRAKESRLVANAGTVSAQIEIIVESTRAAERTIAHGREEIDTLRKENNRIKSMICVDHEKIEALGEENRKLNSSLGLQIKERDGIESAVEQERRKVHLCRLTIAEFQRLKSALGLPPNARTDDVVATAVSFSRGQKQSTWRGRVSLSSRQILSELADLCSQIDRIYCNKKMF
jgi:chromosome segregation ATPase